jgi:hypothetical protein
VLPADASVVAGTTVQLAGASSYATDGTALQAYAWSASPNVPLSDATTATPSWDTTGLPGGTRVSFSLQVQDVRGVWSSAPARMTYELVDAARPTVLEHLAAGGTSTDTSTSASWAPRGGDELLTVVALRPARTTVASVAGNGVTWERVLRRQDEQGELALEVWRATAVAAGSGPVTVRTASAAWTLNVQHLRLSPSQVVAAVGTDTGPFDTRTPHVDVVSRGPGSSALGIHVGRATPFVPYPGLATLAEQAVGTGGGLVRVTLLDAGARPEGVVGLGGTQSSPLD